MTKPLMILGTASGVGKSILTTGLCRILHQDGRNVAPFKSQNMSSNGYVLPNGLEIAKSQAIQAWACGIEPHVDMNPVMLKPVNGVTDVFVHGRSIGQMNRDEYMAFKNNHAWPCVMQSYQRLANEHEIIVLEGAGSPVEINMKENDIANMNMAIRANAPVILAADIERGGVFAQVNGTLSLFTDAERSRVKGIVINKCMGDMASFADVKSSMEEMSGLPVVGMVPHFDVQIEDEDNLCDVRTGLKKPASGQEQQNLSFDSLAERLRIYLNLDAIVNVMEQDV